MVSILEQLDAALRTKNMKDATASKLAGGNASLIKNIRNGGGNIGIETLQKLADVLDLELYFGPKRAVAPAAPLRIADGEFLPIAERAAQLAAGDGAINDHDLIIGHLIFRKDWLSHHGIVAAKATLARVKGNSMAPCILDGDLVLIDTRETEIPVRELKRGKLSPVYAFHQDGADRVKRIARPTADLVMILSDNPDYPPEVVTGARLKAMNIIGRVRWWGHTVRD